MNLTELAVKTVYWFFLYGFIGWGVEVVYAAVKTHALVNRGFLCGPICPIYGFGMVGLIYSVSLIPLPDSGSMSAVAIFFIGMILTTAIELVGGWALFKIYHIRWWDYSNMKFNLGGYICPQFSLLWGLGSVLMIKVVHPLLARGSSPMPFNIMLIVDVVLLVLFVVDVAASTAAAIGLNKYLREIDELRAKLRVTSDKLTTVLGTGAMTADTILDEQKLQLALAKLEGRENADVLRAELTVRAAALREKLTAAEHDHLGTRRLLRAFPDMKSLNYADTLAATRAAMLRLLPRGADMFLLISSALSPLFGMSNVMVDDKRTEFDWISRDENVVASYVADKKCNFIFTSSAFRDLFMLVQYCSDRSWYNKVRHDLPVLIMGGTDDPVGTFGRGVMQIFRSMERHGFDDVELKLWDGCRHELLNETNRLEVYKNISDWLEEKLG